MLAIVTGRRVRVRVKENRGRPTRDDASADADTHMKVWTSSWIEVIKLDRCTLYSKP